MDDLSSGVISIKVPEILTTERSRRLNFESEWSPRHDLIKCIDSLAGQRDEVGIGNFDRAAMFFCELKLEKLRKK